MALKIPHSARHGFTIVELIIVVVVIAILAAITIVSYNGVSGNAKDAQRASDLRAISDALKLYYLDNGRYPASAGGSGPPAGINSSWTTTTDGSWQNLEAQLVPKYMPSLPVDPENTNGLAVIGGEGRGYAYFTGSYCGSTTGQMYILVTRMSGDQKDHFEGDCSTNALHYPGRSNWRSSQ